MLKKMTKIQFRSMFLTVILVGIGSFFFLHDFERRNIKLNDNNIKIITSESEWTKNKVELTVNYTGSKEHIKEYSFDGGKTWTKSNMSVVSSNGIIDIRVKDINDNIYKTEYTVDNLDNEGPVILTDSNVQVSVNSKMDLKQYVTVYDEGIGLRDEVVLTPNTIDTSKIGTHTIQVYAIDKLANKTITSFNISVVNGPVSVNPKNISLDKVIIILSPGEEEVVKAQIAPITTTNKTVKWISKDPKVASIDNTGKVTGISQGKTIITAELSNGLKTTCNVIVK